MLTALAEVAEMERDLFIERTQSGFVHAKAAGTVLGCPSKTNAEQRLVMTTDDKK